MGTMKRLSAFNFGLKLVENRFGIRIQQTRTTFVLKRRFLPDLNKVDSHHPSHLLKPRHFIYDLVENTNNHKLPNLDVILTSFIEGLGEPGDVVSVKRNYGRFQLILPKLGVYASPENLEEYSKLIEERKLNPKKTYSSPFASLTIRALTKKNVLVRMNSKEPWILEPWHLRVALRNAEIVAPTYAIELPEQPIMGPDLQKEGKEFAIFLTINKSEKIPVRCRIHHQGLDLEPDWVYKTSDPLFTEQTELLKSMPLPATAEDREKSLARRPR